MSSGKEPKLRINAGTVVVLLAILYFAVLLRSDWVKSFELRAEREKLLGEIHSLTKRAAALKKEISLLDTPAHIELLAREKLGLIKPNETPYKVVESDL